jgi:hypothetical protein
MVMCQAPDHVLQGTLSVSRNQAEEGKGFQVREGRPESQIWEVAGLSDDGIFLARGEIAAEADFPTALGLLLACICVTILSYLTLCVDITADAASLTHPSCVDQPGFCGYRPQKPTLTS